MKQKKYGIFYHLTEPEPTRKYWIGTFTSDGSACKEPFADISGRGNEALKKAKLLLAALNKPVEVYIYVEGGNIQGASASVPLSFNIYDKDCLENDEEYEKDNGTPEAWDEMITKRTAAGELMPVY